MNCEPHDEWTQHETNKHSRIWKTNMKTRTTRHNDGSRTRAGNVRMRFYAGNVCDSLKIFERAVVFVYFHPPRHRARSRVSHCSGARIHRANRFLKTVSVHLSRGVMIKNNCLVKNTTSDVGVWRYHDSSWNVITMDISY